MASLVANYLIPSLRSVSRRPTRTAQKKLVCQCPCQRRNFHVKSAARKATDGEKPVKASSDRSEFDFPPWKFDIDALNPKDRASYEHSSAEQQQAYRNEQKKVYEKLTTPDGQAEMREMMARLMRDPGKDLPPMEFEEKRVRPGYFNYGEDEPNFVGEDEEFEGDDLTELGHAELDRHREIRHYARLAAWEMPLLINLAKPFEPPSAEHILRFRYTTYMGEDHPAGKKIVVEFSTADLPDLTPTQRVKLVKLAGPRYNPETDVVKMSCEMFETPAQNKRYLGDLVDELLAEARNATDTFEDVPLDFRHHKFESKPVFPDEWKLTEEKARSLGEARRLRLEAGGTGGETGDAVSQNVVDGASIIERAMAALPREEARPKLQDAAARGRLGAGAKRSGGGGRQMLR